MIKVHSVTTMVFPVVMNECESWSLKKIEGWKIDVFKLWCLETLENPLECKEIKPLIPKGNQLGIFIERTDAEAKAPILWPPFEKR